MATIYDPTYQESPNIAFSELDMEPESLSGGPETTMSTPPSGQVAIEQQMSPVAPAVPLTPAPAVFWIKRPVRGRYRNTGSGFQLELRVDVDGHRPMNRLSGDFFSTSGATTSYFGSFIVDAPTVTVTSSMVTVEGLGRYTWSAGAPKIKVTIPRTTILLGIK